MKTLSFPETNSFNNNKMHIKKKKRHVFNFFPYCVFHPSSREHQMFSVSSYPSAVWYCGSSHQLDVAEEQINHFHLLVPQRLHLRCCPSSGQRSHSSIVLWGSSGLLSQHPSRLVTITAEFLPVEQLPPPKISKVTALHLHCAVCWGGWSLHCLHLHGEAKTELLGLFLKDIHIFLLVRRAAIFCQSSCFPQLPSHHLKTDPRWPESHIPSAQAMWVAICRCG